MKDFGFADQTEIRARKRRRICSIRETVGWLYCREARSELGVIKDMPYSHSGRKKTVFLRVLVSPYWPTSTTRCVNQWITDKKNSTLMADVRRGWMREKEITGRQTRATIQPKKEDRGENRSKQLMGGYSLDSAEMIGKKGETPILSRELWGLTAFRGVWC